MGEAKIAAPGSAEGDTYQYLRGLLSSNFKSILSSDKDRVHTLHLQDGVIQLESKWLAFNLIFWRPLLDRGFPINFQRHGFRNERLSNDIRIRIHTNIYNDILATGDQRAIVASRFEMVDAISEIYNFIAVYLAAYQRSISIIKIAKTMKNPVLAKAAHIDLDNEEKIGIKAVENKIKSSFDELYREFAKTENAPNVFAPFIQNGILSKEQFPQCVGAGGTRTDTGDKMVLKPIRNSYLDGLEDICAYAIDSLQAKKSKLYNKEEMPNTQYNNRKQQLLASTIRYLYAGDCGTDVLVLFPIREKFKQHVYGKYVVGEDGNLIELHAGNIDRFVNRSVLMRSPMTCRHTDGFCQTCGGRLTLNMSLETVPGILSAILVMAPIAQLVLSNKHFSKTFASLFTIPIQLMEYLAASQNEIRLQLMDGTLDQSRVCLGVYTGDVRRMLDLNHAKSDAVKNDIYFSDVRGVMIGYKSEDGTQINPLTNLVPLVDKKDKDRPYFAAPFLGMVRDNPEVMEVHGDMTWFSLGKLDPKKPIMRCISMNQSTKQLVRKIEHMFTDDLAGFTDITEALTTVSDTIWEKTSPNLMHIEVMLRASMITDANNYDIPVVNDPGNVMFGKLGRIIPRRSIGTQMAFERTNQYFTAPETFVLPKRPGVFDAFMNFT